MGIPPSPSSLAQRMMKMIDNCLAAEAHGVMQVIAMCGAQPRAEEQKWPGARKTAT